MRCEIRLWRKWCLCQAVVRPSFQVFGTWFFFLIPPDLKKMEGKDPLDPLALSSTCLTSLKSSTRLIADKTIWRWTRPLPIVRCSTAPPTSCVNYSLMTVSSAMRSIQRCRQGKGQRSPSCLLSSAIVFRWILLICGQWGRGMFMVRCSARSWPWKTIWPV